MERERRSDGLGGKLSDYVGHVLRMQGLEAVAKGASESALAELQRGVGPIPEVLYDFMALRNGILGIEYLASVEEMLALFDDSTLQRRSCPLRQIVEFGETTLLEPETQRLIVLQDDGSSYELPCEVWEFLLFRNRLNEASPGQAPLKDRAESAWQAVALIADMCEGLGVSRSGGLSAAAISAVEGQLGRGLPGSLSHLWQIQGACSVSDGAEQLAILLGPNEALECAAWFASLERERRQPASSGDVWWSNDWLPIASSGSRNHLCVDLASGEVIHFSPDSCDRPVVWADVSEMLVFGTPWEELWMKTKSPAS